MRIDKELRLIEIKKIIENKNANFISGEYVNQKSKFLIECELGHIWNGSAHNIYNGHWCKKCASIQEPKYSINDLTEIIFIKNNKTKLNIMCKFGYKFSPSVICLVNGSWCHSCHSKSTKMDQKQN